MTKALSVIAAGTLALLLVGMAVPVSSQAMGDHTPVVRITVLETIGVADSHSPARSASALDHGNGSTDAPPKPPPISITVMESIQVGAVPGNSPRPSKNTASPMSTAQSLLTRSSSATHVVETVMFNPLQAADTAPVGHRESLQVADPKVSEAITVSDWPQAVPLVSETAIISDIITSNVADLSFTVSWITNVDTTGQINYGTSPDSLDSTAYDDRGEATEDDTHHVTISSLVANTTYYFDVVSGETTDDNSGAHYQVTTGPGLDFKMPELISGTAYQMDGETPAEGAIIYATIGYSQVLSGLVDENGTWGLNIAPIRTADYQSYYAYSDSDDISLEAQGGGVVGDASQTLTVAEARAGAPAMTLVPNHAPIVENVTASQDSGTGTISIEYDVYEQDEEDTGVEVSFAYWNGSAYVTCTTVTGDGTKAVSTSPTHYTATWDAKTDFDGQYMTTFKIKVLANDGNILGVGDGISESFTLDTQGPAGVAPSSPADGATEVELSPTLTAVEASDSSTPISYYFLIAKDQEFQTGVQEGGWLSTTTWVPSTRLEAPTVDYWWKVRAKDAFGNVTESSAFTFTTLAVVPVDVELVDGWNIIALAAEPIDGYSASTLAEEINDQGGSITQVFWWNAEKGAWDFYMVDIQYGTDFDIEVGYGYLLKNTTPASWTYWGVPLPAGQTAEVSLVDGWNLIALPVEPATSYTASTMAEEINGQGGNITQVFWWNAQKGAWDFYMVDIGYGTDFDIEMGEGYLLKSTRESTWNIPGS